MIEFLQNYGIWIALIAGMFLMHRLGIGCCGGHSHGDAPETEPKPTDTKAVAGEKPAAVAATSPPRRGSCH